uniref:Uncharacterized protein n=1 Tax=Manihot esculenta TaxID=3983 RepID=A0A2C9V5X6_MANES
MSYFICCLQSARIDLYTLFTLLMFLSLNSCLYTPTNSQQRQRSQSWASLIVEGK